MSNKGKPYFTVLTGFRAVAAYLVFFNHYPLRNAGNAAYNISLQLFIGVSFFFVLSGFLITMRYQEQMQQTKQWLFTYFKNRFARIYPMYFLITSFTWWYYLYYIHAPGVQAITTNPLWAYIANITFIRGFFEQLILTGVPQGWTLTVEECFYACAPLIFMLSAKFNLRRQAIALYATAIILWLACRHINFYGLFGSLTFMFGQTFFGRCLDFYLGVYLARLYKRGGRLPIITKHFTLTGCLLLAATVALLVFARGNYEFTIYSPVGILINNWVLPFAISVFFWGLLQEKTIISKLLSTPLFSLLGKSSYTFYLIHVGVISEWLNDNVTNNYLLNFPILIVIAIALFKLVEEPLHRLIKGEKLYDV